MKNIIEKNTAFKKTAIAIFALSAALMPSRAIAQLKLVQTLTFPQDTPGKFDHFGVDLKHDRLFATPESAKRVDVFNLRTGRYLRSIPGIDEPHAILYREDLNRLYVTDGEDGSLRIVDGASYKILKTVKLLIDADCIGYDPKSHYLYVTNGGKDAKLDYVNVSVIDTDKGEKVTDIRAEGDTLEAMVLESGSSRMYVNNSAKNTVEVIDREQNKIIESWPITMGRMNVAIALDEPNHRLFLGCRDGHLVVLDTVSGKELQALQITKGKTDDMSFDPMKRRLYVATTGAVDTYQQIDPNHYRLLGTVKTGSLAKTASLVPELNRYFVAVPKDSGANAEILAFAVQ